MYKTGLMPSPIDKRDYRFSVYNELHELPKKFERKVLYLKNQGRMGSCVGFASSYVKDEHEYRNHPGYNFNTSPLYVYAECKKRDGIPEIEGTYLRVANDVLRQQGVCLEQTFPYSDQKPVKEVPDKAHAEAANFVIRNYVRVESVREIKQAIVEHGNVLAGVLVLSNFMVPEKSKDGAFIPKPEGFIYGGHAISLIGYDDDLEYTYADGKKYRGFVKFVNSWKNSQTGQWWGDNGMAWIPYEVLFRELAPEDMPGLCFMMEAWCWMDEIKKAAPAKRVVMWIGQRQANVDGHLIEIDQPPVIDGDSHRTLIPARFVSEILGYDVTWVQDEKKIIMERRGGEE